MAGPYKYSYHYSDTHLFGNLTGPNNWSVLVPFDEATRWPSVIAELNRLHAEVERLREEVDNNIEAHENAARHCDRLYAEVERLREENKMLKSLPLEWQPLPNPPVKEKE